MALDSTCLECDVAIVGGGIVGTTLAAALKPAGLRIAIVEAQCFTQGTARDRAYAITLLSAEILQGISAWPQILPQVAAFRQIHLSDADYSRFLPFLPQDLGREPLGYVARHRTLLSALQTLTANCDTLHWLCPAQVTDVAYESTHAELSLELNGQPQKLRTKLVVAADGSQSRLRRWAGIATRGWKYWQSCVTFTIQHQSPRNDTAFERFSPAGPMGVLPLPGNRCQIVWTAPHAEAQALQSLDPAAFIAKLEQHLGGLLDGIQLASDRLVFPVQLLQCDRYIAPRLALIGDAAHCCHPVGGQGLNLGLRDAAALAQVLQEAYGQQEDLGEERVLRRYERWRKPENLVILALTDLLNRFFSNRWLPAVVARRCGLEVLRYLPPFKRLLLEWMTGLRGRQPQISQTPPCPATLSSSPL
ncbi:MAG: FAD-dependent hydroxylase [Chloroflexaceae bacterium]|nr:FAD-dependent hydroxylase [Chloroflexaceae bacterium]